MHPDASELRARWVFPVDHPPIENGVVRVAQGCIAEVRPVDAFAPADARSASLALIPGLVNAHTHLEFSDLQTPLTANSTFADWIRSVIEYRRERTMPIPEILAAGLHESAAAGVTTLGEICTAGWSAEPFQPETPRAVAFREAISLDPSAADRVAATISVHVEALRRDSELIPAVSPHAPYSVHPDLFRKLVAIARGSSVPLAFHLAETRDELELLAEGTGPLVELFDSSGFWQPDAIPRGARPLDYLRMLESVSHTLVIHGNYLDAEEIDFLAGKPQFTVVYCPRTHAHFGHDAHPWLELCSRGVRVALGTDSRASNPDLSVWNELLYLRDRFPDVGPFDLLELGTRAGAAALGLDQRIGTLTPGKSADVTVLELAGADLDDPRERLLHPETRPIAAIRNGNWIATPTQ